MTYRTRAVALAVIVGCVSCSKPPLKKIAGPWYLDDVPAGKPSPHLYWMKQTGTMVVVDRQILSYSHPGCLIYETVRPGSASVVFAVDPGKTPVLVATSDSFRPWRLARDGLRRFSEPSADEHGVTRLDMDTIEISDLCTLAWRQPAFSETWVDEPLSPAEVKTEHVSFDVNGADSVGNSTLSDEARLRHPDVVDALLRAGADVDAPNRSGGTPLMTAIAFNHEDTIIVKRMLEAGADVNAQDKRGMTALMVAARYSRKEAVALLLAHGADPSIRDNEGRNAASMTRDSDVELNRLLNEAARRR